MAPAITRWMSVVAAATLVAAVLGLAPSTSIVTHGATAEVEVGAIAGVVTTGDGQPLEGAVVTAVVSGEVASMVTGVSAADGSYQIDDLPAADNYVVHFDAGTYGACFGSVECALFRPTPVAVSAGIVTEGIDGVLVPPSGGSMAGRVTDGEGTGLPQALVWVVGESWSRVTIVRTDALGAWTATGLPAGDYFVAVMVGGTTRCFTSPTCAWGAPPTPLGADEHLTGVDVAIPGAVVSWVGELGVAPLPDADDVETWQVTATISVAEQEGTPVEGAAVTVRFRTAYPFGGSYLPFEFEACTTDATGTCSVAYLTPVSDPAEVRVSVHSVVSDPPSYTLPPARSLIWGW